MDFFAAKKKTFLVKIKGGKKPEFFFCFFDNFLLLKGTAEIIYDMNGYWIPHLPSKFEVSSMETSYFFFNFVPKNRPFFRFSYFLALWPPPKFWVLEVRVQIQVSMIQVGPKLLATIFPWMDPASPFLQLEKTWKRDTQKWKVASSSKGSNPDPLLPGCGFGRYSNLRNTHIVGF